ncbi:MFS transporter [Sphaerisporangium aureirubrum]|uniref:MFS transporter n=1 Tax=Sphaerisporangium aureirubrum TaxID=1544736 RepID=A0ABW1NNF4_9ACTN
MPTRTFAYLWSSTTLSNLADGVLKVGAPLLAVTLTRSPSLVALTGAAVTLPWLLLALHAGAMADRHDRRRIMIATNTLRACALTLTAAATALGHLTLPLLLAALLLTGTAEVFSDTSAQSILPMTVPPDRLTTANGRIVGAQTVGNDFLGGPTAGVLAALSTTALFLTPATLYAAAATLLLGMRGHFHPHSHHLQDVSAGSQDVSTRPQDVSTRPQDVSAGTQDVSPSPRPLRADIAEGLRYLRGHRVLRAVAVAAGLLNTANAAYWAVFVLWAVGDDSPIGLTPGGYGLVMTAIATGALLGSLTTAPLLRLLGDKPTLLATWLTNSLLLLTPVLLPHPLPTYTAAVLIGITGAMSNVIVVSLRHRLIPTPLLGRVNSAYRLIGMGGMPIGAAAGGLLADLTTLPTVFLTSVAICLIAVTVIARAVPADQKLVPA